MNAHRNAIMKSSLNNLLRYNRSKQKRLSFGNDLATQSNAKALSKKIM